jgi:hypothetical protein
MGSGKVRYHLTVSYVVPSSQIFSTLMMEAIRSSETSVLTRATQRHSPEDGIPHSHRLEKPQIVHSINLLGSVTET